MQYINPAAILESLVEPSASVLIGGYQLKFDNDHEAGLNLPGSYDRAKIDAFVRAAVERLSARVEQHTVRVYFNEQRDDEVYVNTPNLVITNVRDDSVADQPLTNAYD